MTRTFAFFTNTSRATNALTTTQSESPLEANGWTKAGGITSVAAGSNTGPFGFGVGATVTSAASGTREYTFPGPTTMPAAGVTVSMFVRRGTLDLIRLGVKDTTALVVPSIDGAWNTALGKYLTATPLSGGIGSVLDAEFDNNWQRMTLSCIPGLTAAMVAGNSYQILVQPQGLSKTIDIWGVTLETNASQAFNGTGTQRVFNVTGYSLGAGDRVFATVGGVLDPNITISEENGSGFRVTFLGTAPAAGANNVLIVRVRVATPYLSGLGPFGPRSQGLPVYRLQDSDDAAVLSPMLFQAGVSDGNATLQVRNSAAQPWIDVFRYDRNSTSNPFGLGSAGTLTYQIDPTQASHPAHTAAEMRVLITTMADGDIHNASISS